jgi:dihydrofolate reductase
MRRIRMYNNVSADGYFADEHGKLDWFVQDPELNKEAVSGSSQNDAVMLGRKTYEMFASFWPKVAAEAEGGKAKGPHGGGPSAEIVAMAKFLDDAKKIVFSKSLRDPTWRNTRVFHELNPATVEALKREPGKNIIVFGSGSIVSQLTRLGLIDVYDFVVNPVLIGNGHHLFEDVAVKSKLRLVESKAYPTGTVVVRYERAG